MEGDTSKAKALWFPILDVAKCVGCRECFEFCPHGVYEWDESENHPVVAHPDECVPGCKACAKICDQDAITFPARTIYCTCGEDE